MVGRPMWAKTKRRTLFLRLAGDFCDAISRFEQDYMGREPKAIHTSCSVISYWSASRAF